MSDDYGDDTGGPELDWGDAASFAPHPEARHARPAGRRRPTGAQGLVELWRQRIEADEEEFAEIEIRHRHRT